MFDLLTVLVARAIEDDHIVLALAESEFSISTALISPMPAPSSPAGPQKALFENPQQRLGGSGGH